MRRSIPEDATLWVIKRIHSVEFEKSGDRPLKKNSNSQTKSGQKTKPTKARGPVQRDSKEVMAELVAKLSERLDQKPAGEGNGGEATERAWPQWGPAHGRSGPGRPMEQLLHFGAGGRDAGGRTVADH